MNKPLNITDAMKQQRDCDRIIAVLNNKFCLARCLFTNGNYDTCLTIFSLNNGKVYSLGDAQNIGNLVEKYIANMPNVSTGLSYNEQTKRHEVKHNKNKKYKQQFRRALKAVREYEAIRHIQL